MLENEFVSRAESHLPKACKTFLIAKFLRKQISHVSLRNTRRIYNFNHLNASKIMHFKRE